MADRNVEISFKTSADVAGADAAAKAIAGVEAAVEKLEKEAPQAAAAVKQLQSAIVQAETVTKNTSKSTDSLNESVTKSGRSAVNSGHAMMTLGRGVQDLQYGIGGVLNNIEGLVMALGGTAGLAGVLTLVGVGIAMLLPMLKGQADEAEKAAKKQAELAAESDKSAAAAEAQAESIELSTAAMEAQKTVLDEIIGKYKAFSEAVAEAIKLRDDERRRNLEEADAQAGADMAEVDLQEKQGQLTPQEAEKKRRGIMGQTEARRHAAEQEKRAEDEAKQRADAAFQKAQAEEKERAAGDLAGKSRGLLTPEERAAAEARKKAAEDKWEASENARKEADKEAQFAAQQEGKAIPGSANAALWKERREAAEKRRLEEAQKGFAAVNEREGARGALRDDKLARERSGFKDAGEAEAELKRLREEVEKLKEQAARGERGADSLGRTRESSERAFQNRQRTGDLRSQGRIMDLDEKEQREREREQQREERSSGAGGGRGRARSSGGGGGTSGGGVLQNWSDAETARDLMLKGLAQQLSASIPRIKSQMEEMAAAVEALRSGH